jgi:hypothetical protein
MFITRVSTLTGIVHTMDLDVTQEQMDIWELPATIRPHLQDVFFNLPKEEREFIYSGITPQEWIKCFGTGEEEDPE